MPASRRACCRAIHDAEHAELSPNLNIEDGGDSIVFGNGACHDDSGLTRVDLAESLQELEHVPVRCLWQHIMRHLIGRFDVPIVLDEEDSAGYLFCQCLKTGTRNCYCMPRVRPIELTRDWNNRLVRNVSNRFQ